MIFSSFHTRILQAPAGRKIQFELGKNPVHQTRYFKFGELWIGGEGQFSDGLQGKPDEPVGLPNFAGETVVFHHFIVILTVITPAISGLKSRVLIV